jgi:hypothetical protein
MIATDATLSDCGTYRYTLSRIWQENHPPDICCFVMLNPSTADAQLDDPTIRRCIGYAKEWGYDGLWVRNLFAYRATQPKDMLAASKRGVDIRGGFRADEALEQVREAKLIVAAWGRYPCKSRAAQFLDMMGDRQVWCLGKNQDGSPVHPLYQPADAPLMGWPHDHEA